MESLELILVVFRETNQASLVLKILKKHEKDGSFHLYSAAALVKGPGEKIRIEEPQDLGAGRGSLFGAIVGGLVGLLGGPAGVLVGATAGAATGGVVASKIDLGFSKDFLDRLGKALKPDSSAILVLVEEPWNEQVAKELGQEEGKLFRHVLKSEILQELEKSQKEQTY